jgi:hypothetical protein
MTVVLVLVLIVIIIIVLIIIVVFIIVTLNTFCNFDKFRGLLMNNFWRRFMNRFLMLLQIDGKVSNTQSLGAGLGSMVAQGKI